MLPRVVGLSLTGSKELLAFFLYAEGAQKTVILFMINYQQSLFCC